MHLGGSLSSTVLSAMPRLTHIYLQHNQLSSMAGLAALPALRFAALSHNNIEQVEGIVNLPCLMFLDLSFNRLHKLDVQQLPRSVGFLKVAGNPCTQSGSRSLRAELQAHLPRLRDLDGPLSEGDDDTSVSDGAEQEQGSSGDEQDEQGLEAEGDLPDDGPPLPHLPQISDDGLPGSKDYAKESAEIGDLGVDGVEGAAGGNGRLVRSALDMLEELERACYASASRASRDSLRMSMSRAMRSVAEHPAMRSWRSTAGGLGGKAGAVAREVEGVQGEEGVGSEGVHGSRRSDDLAALPGRPSSGGSAAAAAASGGVFGRPRSGGGSGGIQPASADVSISTGPSSGGAPYLGPLPGAVPTLSESSTAPGLGGRSLRPVTPPASALASLRSSSARLGSLEHAPLPPHLLTTPGGQQGRPLSTQAQDSDEVLQQRVEADLDLLRTRLRDLTEPLTAAALRRAPGTSLAPAITGAATPPSQTVAAAPPSQTLRSPLPAVPSIAAPHTHRSTGAEPAASVPSSSHIDSTKVSTTGASDMDFTRPTSGAVSKPSPPKGTEPGGAQSRGPSTGRAGSGTSTQKVGSGASTHTAGSSASIQKAGDREGRSAGRGAGGERGGRTGGSAGRGKAVTGGRGAATGRGEKAAGRGVAAKAARQASRRPAAGSQGAEGGPVASSSEPAPMHAVTCNDQVAGCSDESSPGVLAGVEGGRGEGADVSRTEGDRGEGPGVSSTQGTQGDSAVDAAATQGNSAVNAEKMQGHSTQQPSSSRPTSAVSASRTLLWSASARPPPSATHSRPSSAASVGSRPASAIISRPGSARERPGSGSEGGGRPGSVNRVLRPASADAPRSGPGSVDKVRPVSAGMEGSRPGSVNRVRPASADMKGSRPGSTLRAGSPGGGGRGAGRGIASSIPGGSIGAAQDPVADLTQPTLLREEVEHKKAAAAARLAQQRAQQAALSGAIRALRQGAGGGLQGQTMAELRSSLTLRAAVEAGPGAADAVRAALASVRSNQDHLTVGSTGGLVSSALRDHASGLAATPYGARAAAVASQDNSLRNSMARLERLTASTKAALALRQQQSTGEGLDDAEQGNGAASDEGSSAEMSDDHMSVGAGMGRAEGSIASAPSSKYLELIRARAQARATIAEESEHEDEGN
ncbi:hypothetical protein DUNSADRAFT_9488 [Dunaliella salina]|uniref:Uncharacterized protein n=1 Tax=Dunaliella salina TaxID=3046 RepID=A0ABQ7GHB8_DUNSA|nr:hypothetical protein DUNSADRAFT_9488 [Dunaliella salina]|eukprot:KAF5834003.1 hypothetical protein DUNSADRAFT_9488 [Dunaliella salina]